MASDRILRVFHINLTLHLFELEVTTNIFNLLFKTHIYGFKKQLFDVLRAAAYVFVKLTIQCTVCYFDTLQRPQHLPKLFHRVRVL